MKHYIEGNAIYCEKDGDLYKGSGRSITKNDQPYDDHDMDYMLPLLRSARMASITNTTRDLHIQRFNAQSCDVDISYDVGEHRIHIHRDMDIHSLRHFHPEALLGLYDNPDMLKKMTAMSPANFEVSLSLILHTVHDHPITVFDLPEDVQYVFIINQCDYMRSIMSNGKYNSMMETFTSNDALVRDNFHYVEDTVINNLAMHEHMMKCIPSNNVEEMDILV